jgi:MFS superfamily sulfate permease-like transporter
LSVVFEMIMSAWIAFRPKLAETLINYSRPDFAADLVAGVTVGIVALPLAMALAIASGLNPEIGIFTSIVVIVLAAAGSACFHLADKFGIQTLGTAFGEMPHTLPGPHWPSPVTGIPPKNPEAMLALDATGLDALEDLNEKLRKHKKELILCGPHSQPLFALTRSGLLDRLGMENVCGDMDVSLSRTTEILACKKNGAEHQTTNASSEKTPARD